MKPVLRYQSQLLYRRSYKPARSARRSLGITFRPAHTFALKVEPRAVTQAPAYAAANVTALSG